MFSVEKITYKEMYDKSEYYKFQIHVVQDVFSWIQMTIEKWQS